MIEFIKWMGNYFHGTIYASTLINISQQWVRESYDIWQAGVKVKIEVENLFSI